ncbi:MAG: hypothetical protein KGQ46_02010 [Hyphomicrobiales bacterium]|nr:hypothetical protein [Hyphomicrobiales bacterium]MDE2115536.1 hypothetical protein [Hyphomicrobiales bacterium]
MPVTSPAMPQTGTPQSIDAKPLPASFTSIAVLTLAGVIVSMAMTMKLLVSVLTRGLLVDTDDAMRMSQVRAFMDGQGWYDLLARQLDPPNGVFMHWSRLVDVPIAILWRAFSWGLSASYAERWTRVVFPLLLLGLLFWLVLRIARLVAGEIGPVLAMLLTVASGAASGYFQPGRLDHDHVSVVLLMAMAYCLLQALGGKIRWAAAAGLLVAAQLAVSLETLPFVVVGVAILPCGWIVGGPTLSRSLRSFALGLLVGLLALFPLVVEPSKWLEGSCDTYSMAHLLAGGTGALLCIGLALATPRLASLRLRLLLALLAGAATVLVVKIAYPACLGDPYAGVDPVLKRVWLMQVQEAETWPHEWARAPSQALVQMLPLLIGLIGQLGGAWHNRGVVRGRWLALAALTMAGIATCFWEVRAFGETEPIALLGAVWLLSRAAGPLLASGKAYAGILLVVMALAISPIGFALALPSPAIKTAHQSSKSCREDTAFTALNGLPHGIAATPVDTGAFIMARTPLGVLAAPFHRDTHGIRAVIDIFSNPPSQAEAYMRASGARYLIYCGVAPGFKMFLPFGDASLAASLTRGHVPDWLQPLNLDTPYKVLELKPST